MPIVEQHYHGLLAAQYSSPQNARCMRHSRFFVLAVCSVDLFPAIWVQAFQHRAHDPCAASDRIWAILVGFMLFLCLSSILILGSRGRLSRRSACGVRVQMEHVTLRGELSEESTYVPFQPSARQLQHMDSAACGSS